MIPKHQSKDMAQRRKKAREWAEQMRQAQELADEEEDQTDTPFDPDAAGARRRGERERMGRE